MDDNDQRQYAGVEARVLINQHMADCATRWERLEGRLGNMSADIKTLNTRLLLIIGGLIVVGKIFDLGVTYFHK